MKKRQLWCGGVAVCAILLLLGCEIPTDSPNPDNQNPNNQDPGNQPPVILVDTPITSVSVTITPPAKDMVSATAATVNTGNYTAGTVIWSPTDNPFKGGVAYTAMVTLTAANGYTFNSLTGAYINGQTAAVSNNTGTSVDLTYTFPATDNRIVMGIEIVLQPTKLVYNHDDALNLAGLMVKLYFESGEPDNVSYANFAARNIIASPAHGEMLSTAAHNGKPVIITCGNQTTATSPLTVNRINPIADDFTVSGTGTFSYNGVAKVVTVTAKSGKTTGTVIVKYNGSTAAPVNAGTYTVTFDVAADTNYNAVNSLSAGTLTINPTAFSGSLITFTQIAEGAPSLGGPIIIHHSSTNGQTAYTFILDNPDQYSSIAWYVYNVSGSGGTFTLNSSNIAYNMIGTHVLTLEVVKGGLLYTKVITFEVKQ